MRWYTALLAMFALATSVLALDDPALLPTAPAVVAATDAHLDARAKMARKAAKKKTKVKGQTSTATGPSASCTAALTSMVNAMPTPAGDAALGSFVATAAPVRSSASSLAAAASQTTGAPDPSALCSAVDRVERVTPPASLSAAYAAWTRSLDGWQSSQAPAASSMAPQCGELGPVLEALVARDGERCRRAAAGAGQSSRSGGETNAAARLGAVVAVVGAVAAVAAF